MTFPGVIKHGVALTAANIDKSWIGTDLGRAPRAAHPRHGVTSLNDADAAGWPRCATAPAATSGGVVLLLTFGTGIGSALFLDGQLVPNTEFGHIQIDGEDAETPRLGGRPRAGRASAGTNWAKRVDRYLDVPRRRSGRT